MTKGVRHSLFFIFLFYVNFQFVFERFHYVQDFLFLAVCAGIIIFNYPYFKKYINPFEYRHSIFFLLFAFMTIFSIFYPMFRQTMDLTYFRRIYFSSIQLIVTHLALGILYIRMFRQDATLKLLIKFYIFSALFYMLTTVILSALPSLREFWIDILYISNRDVRHLGNPRYYTRIGIDGFAGFRQTLRFSIISVLNGYLLIDNLKRQIDTSIFYYITLIIILLGTLLYGRIGSIVVIIMVIIVIFYHFRYQNGVARAISFIIASMGIFLGLIGLSFINETIQIWMSWAFEIVITYFETGEATSASTTVLFETMYFVPELEELLIGHAYFRDPFTGGYFGSTDVGFLRSLLFFGIGPTILNYMIPTVMIGYISADLLKRKKENGWIFGISMVMLFVVFEIKGGIYHYLTPYILPIYIVVHYQNNLKKLKEREMLIKQDDRHKGSIVVSN